MSKEKLKSYIKCSIGPEKTRINLPQDIFLAIQNKVIDACRHKNKSRNKANK